MNSRYPIRQRNGLLIGGLVWAVVFAAINVTQAQEKQTPELPQSTLICGGQSATRWINRTSHRRPGNKFT